MDQWLIIVLVIVVIVVSFLIIHKMTFNERKNGYGEPPKRIRGGYGGVLEYEKFHPEKIKLYGSDHVINAEELAKKVIHGEWQLVDDELINVMYWRTDKDIQPLKISLYKDIGTWYVYSDVPSKSDQIPIIDGFELSRELFDRFNKRIDWVINKKNSFKLSNQDAVELNKLTNEKKTARDIATRLLDGEWKLKNKINKSGSVEITTKKWGVWPVNYTLSFESPLNWSVYSSSSNDILKTGDLDRWTRDAFHDKFYITLHS